MNNPAIKRQENNPLKERTLEQLRQLLGGDPKTILENLHIKQGLSQKDIADRFHKHSTTVSQWFKRFGISAKTDKERTLEQLKQLLAGDPKEALEDLYINQGLSMTDIAHRFHKVPSTVSTWFKWLGIPTNHYISGKTNRMRSAHQLGKLLGGDPKKVLEDLYIKQGLSKKDIAHRFHKNTATVGNWFKKLRISAKTNKEIGLEQLKNLLGGDPKEVLEDLHQKQGMSKKDIANRFHKNPSTVSNWFKRFDIKINSPLPAKTKRERSIEQLELLLGRDLKTILEDLYFRQGLSKTDIALRFHESTAKVNYWFKISGTPTIPNREAKAKRERKLEQLKQLLGGDPKTILEDLYFRQSLSQYEIAHHFHMSQPTVNRWFNIFGISINRSKKAAKTYREHKLEKLKQLLGGDPKQVLEDLYFKQKLSRNDIGNRFHRSDATISNWFETLGIAAIPYRPKTGGSINSAAQKLVLSAIKSGLFEKLPQRMKNLLTLRYLQTGKPLTLDEIAEKMGRISRQRIYELEKTTLHYLQINKTPEEERLRHIQNMKNPEYRKRVLARLHSPEAIEKSRLTRLKLYKEDPEISKRISKIRNAQELAQLRQLLGGDPKEVLEDLYFKQGLSTTEIANRFNKTPSTVYAWFKKFGIRIQSRLVRQYELRMKNADAT